MIAFIASLYIEQGTDWNQPVFFYADTAKTTPINLTGLTGRCKIRDLDGNVVASPTVTVTDAVAGQITLSLSNTLTSAIPVDGVTYDATTQLTYDVEMVDAAGKVSRWLNGPTTISPEVTK